MSFITTIREDINTVQTHDPAAQNGLVIFLSYPGLHAKWAHTPEHWLWNHGLHSIARVMSQFTRFMTGVEIHPAAQIGRRLFIDHAMGVVIGETTIVGDDCVLYQGVTLGGTGKECGKRHPTLGDRVTVGTGAKVLGNIRIGDDVKIGGNSVVVKDVPSNSTVVGVPGRVVRRAGCRVLNENMDRREHRESMPDPVQEQSLLNREGSGAKPASRVWIIVLLILLFGGFALIFGGEWGPSTGAAGLAMQACQGVGLITFGISLAMTARLLHLQHRTKTTGTPAAPNERTRDALRREYVQELVMLAPAVAAYAGCALLYLTGVSFLEDETALNLIIMMAFAGGAVALAALVHRRRKRRGVSYKHLGNAGLIAFCLAFAVGGALIGWDIAWRAAVDAANGPATVRCFYRDYDIDRPTGRYAGLHPTKLELAFTNVSGDGTMPNPVVYIAAGDVDAVLDQVFRENAFAIDLTYYPNSNVFVSAEAA